MRTPDHSEVARALERAGDAEGIARLLALLGYSRIDPPCWTDDDLCRVARSNAIDALCLVRKDAGGDSAMSRAARIRALLGGTPRPVLLLCPSPEALTIASGGLDGRPRVRTIPRVAPRPAELETLFDLAPRDEPMLAALARLARSLDRSSLTRRFFRDFRAHRDLVSRAWLGLNPRARADRDQLALLFLSRLVFLHFLQRQGQLLGRDDYLVSVVCRAALEPGSVSVYRRVLRPLFFGVLNRPFDQRDADAARLGPLPYLNGGLFEPHALERARPDLDLPDAAVCAVFEGLFERYRFVSAASHNESDKPGGIEPEMLGRMFEGLMAADRRGRTGTFYTPASVVDRIVRQGLQAWLAGRDGLDWRAAGMLLRERGPAYGSPALLEQVAQLRVIDPACGSGAFVLGALERMTRLRRQLGDARDVDAVKRELAADSLHGVDLEADAALLCALRLWLALTPTDAAPVRPLPNLDQRVRQGDALLDPIELAARGDVATAAWRAAALDDSVRRARRALAARVARYGSAAADMRTSLRRRIGRAEVRLARRWIATTLLRLDATRRAAHARLRARDLFGERPADRRALRAELARVRAARLELRGLARRVQVESALPFFSFALHFGALEESGRSGFDLVVSNPPWVRSHRWPRAFNELIRSRYRVCRDGAWRGSGMRTSAGQVDLALLFVERGLELLRPSGVLALLIPAKAFRSLSAGAARALVRERAHMVSIEDHALHHRAIFRNADAFAGVLVARARDGEGEGDAAPGDTRVIMTHRTSPPLRFRMRAADLPLDQGDARSPWLVVPPDVGRALRAMQRAGAPVHSDPRLAIRRGAMTGANDALLFGRAERKLGDAVVAWPASGDERTRSVLLHTDDLCPVVRGADIRPFLFDPSGFVAWSHDDSTGAPRAPSRRLARYLAPAQARLRARPGWRPGLPDGALFRMDGAMLRPRVAWRDIATDLEVTRLPARIEALGTRRPLVTLNTVYFIALDDDGTANALVALLSSLPCRVFARAIAERAKDARFRFFAWTVGALPLPAAWMRPRMRDVLGVLALRARQQAAGGTIDPGLLLELDDVTCALYGLSAHHVAALRRFDAWLAGRPAISDSTPSTAGDS